jgi:hypothetical protein
VLDGWIISGETSNGQACCPVWNCIGPEVFIIHGQVSLLFLIYIWEVSSFLGAAFAKRCEEACRYLPKAAVLPHTPKTNDRVLSTNYWQEKNSPLHLAAFNGHEDVVRALIELRGSTSAKNEVRCPYK